MKIYLIILIALSTSLALAAIDRGPKKISIDINQAKKAVPDFPHHLHQEMPQIKGNCTFCHHKRQGKKQPRPCRLCHTQAKQPDPKTGAIGFKDAFHARCRQCHRDQKDRPKLKKCKTCHKK